MNMDVPFKMTCLGIFRTLYSVHVFRGVWFCYGHHPPPDSSQLIDHVFSVLLSFFSTVLAAFFGILKHHSIRLKIKIYERCPKKLHLDPHPKSLHLQRVNDNVYIGNIPVSRWFWLSWVDEYFIWNKIWCAMVSVPKFSASERCRKILYPIFQTEKLWRSDLHFELEYYEDNFSVDKCTKKDM
jgi:hypothetical protein